MKKKAVKIRPGLRKPKEPEMDSEDTGTTKRGRGRGRSTRARATSTRARGRGRGRGRKATKVIESDEEGSPEPQETEDVDTSIDEKSPPDTILVTTTTVSAPVQPAETVVEEKETENIPPTSKFFSSPLIVPLIYGFLSIVLQLTWRRTFHNWRRQRLQP